MQTKYIDTNKLQPNPRNARKHSDKQINQIANSIKQFGFLSAIVIDANNTVLSGHGRLEAAKLLKLDKVPVIQASHLKPDELKAYMLADNKIAQNSSWDKELLAEELSHLSSLDINFDVEITGFSTAEIDFITGLDTNPVLEEDEIPDIEEITDPITKTGDIWQLGKHYLICGNALEKDVYKALLGDKKADMVFTDPPYNVPVDGHVCGAGKIKHREFAMASGEMSQEQFIEFLNTNFSLLKEFSKDGSLHYICMDWRHIYEISLAGNQVFSDFKNLCVWAKNNGGMGSLYRSQHELIFIFKNGTGKHLNNVELGKNGRYRTNVWEYAGVNTMRKGRMDDLKMHPTVKPVIMIADAIKDCTKRGDIILDTFAGSGTTLIACEKTKRISYNIEIDPIYCDVIIKRWEKFTGIKAALINSEQTGGQNEQR